MNSSISYDEGVKSFHPSAEGPLIRFRGGVSQAVWWSEMEFVVARRIQISVHGGICSEEELPVRVRSGALLRRGDSKRHCIGCQPAVCFSGTASNNLLNLTRVDTCITCMQYN
ncbi:unnamed protein product [Microthlaspi erraticum]|uniref:Uncharacterized protein n=1 Tax=Microthlaspi erraticum TaxID=1685480 RepID=A0A6D2K217_9BRAS|nr:unnamed protein product [Microthlaspi erraticum]